MFDKPGVDFWSRLPDKVTAEGLGAYRSRIVSAHFDLVFGNMSVSVRAFAPEESLRLAQTLIGTSNKIFKQLAKARQDMLTLREKSGYLALFVQPTLPQPSLYPERVESVLTVLLAAAATSFIGVLISYAVRDHLM